MNSVIDDLRLETSNFELVYRRNAKEDRFELRLRSKSGGKHFAVHTHFSLLDDDDRILSTEIITRDVAEFIFEHFEERGDTASFNIYRSDLANKRLTRNRTPNSIRPEDVRHRITVAENSFTATGAKLAHHWPIFEKFRETGYGSIIRATMTLHQVCSSHCHYCSTIARNRKDAISLQEATEFVDALYDEQAAYNRDHFAAFNERYKSATGSDIRLRGLILSGGGQPNLWPYFESFVAWLGSRNIDLGLITNGFPKNISEGTYEKFKWVRISVTPEDASPHYPKKRFDLQYLPSSLVKNPAITVGYSYVYGPWTNDDVLLRINDSIEQNGFEYCRLLTDCNLTRGAQLRAHAALAERLFRLGFVALDGKPTGKFFHQLKYHGTREEAESLWDDGQCYLQAYNVFWDTTGHETNGYSYCYACDSITVLAEEATTVSVNVSERRFNHEKWGTVTNRDVRRLFTEPVTPFFDPRSVCSACLFMRNNREVKELVGRRLDNSGVSEFVPLKHVNFP